MQNIQGGTSNVQPIKSDGTYAAAGDKGYTLTSATTYYVDLGGKDPSLLAAQILMDANLVITSIDVESTNRGDVLLTSSTAGEWVPEDSASGVYITKTGAGVTITGATIDKIAGAIGAAMVHLFRMSTRRARLKIVVGAAGGVIRIDTWAKQ